MIYGMASTDLGIRIKRAREARGWNRAELADELTRQRGGKRVGVRSIGRWERGETVPRSALGALEVVLAPYFTVNGIPPPPPTDRRERKLWDDLADDVPSEEKRWALIELFRRSRHSA